MKKKSEDQAVEVEKYKKKLDEMEMNKVKEFDKFDKWFGIFRNNWGPESKQ